jgi:hypothetical protein
MKLILFSDQIIWPVPIGLGNLVSVQNADHQVNKIPPIRHWLHLPVRGQIGNRFFSLKHSFSV